MKRPEKRFEKYGFEKTRFKVFVRYNYIITKLTEVNS